MKPKTVLILVAVLVTCFIATGSTEASPSPIVDDPGSEPPTPIKKCTGCDFNDASIGSKAGVVMGPTGQCTVTIKRERDDFSNDDCRDKNSATEDCGASTCSFVWTVSAKISSTGCNNVTFSIGGNQGVTSLSGSYTEIDVFDMSGGQNCGTMPDKIGTVGGEWPNGSGGTDEAEATWNDAVGCTVCAKPQ